MIDKLGRYKLFPVSGTGCQQESPKPVKKLGYISYFQLALNYSVKQKQKCIKWYLDMMVSSRQYSSTNRR